MKQIVIEIDDCLHCPFSVAYGNAWFCQKSERMLIEDDKSKMYPIPDWCPQELNKIKP